jgi:hypothetical protein
MSANLNYTVYLGEKFELSLNEERGLRSFLLSLNYLELFWKEISNQSMKTVTNGINNFKE